MLQKRPRKFRKGLPEPWDWGERQEAPLFCRETSHRALVATAISCTAQRKGNSWESEVVLVSPSTSSLFMRVAALWSGDLFTRARRFPNKYILIKDETQGNARKKEKSPEDAIQRCSLHVVPIPTSALHQVGFVSDSPGREAWTGGKSHTHSAEPFPPARSLIQLTTLPCPSHIGRVPPTCPPK